MATHMPLYLEIGLFYVGSIVAPLALIALIIWSADRD